MDGDGDGDDDGDGESDVDVVDVSSWSEGSDWGDGGRDNLSMNGSQMGSIREEDEDEVGGSSGAQELNEVRYMLF